MVKKFVCLFVMTIAMLLSSQTKAQDSAQRLVDLTAKSGKTTQKGLRKIKNTAFQEVESGRYPRWCGD